MPNSALPSYKKPPVNEVVCGLRFEAPDKLRIPHIGLLWNEFRKEYPNIKHAVPIASSKGDLLIDDETGLPIQRVWFINSSEDALIQFQFDRFYFNWRHKKEDYPRYNNIIKKYQSALKKLEVFFKEIGLGDIVPIEYQLSYINHMPQGEGWNADSDISTLFTDMIWNSKAERFLPNPEHLSWKLRFPISNKMGNLDVSLKRGTRVDDKVQLYVLELTALGTAEAATGANWFDVAHEWIVKGFTDLTTPKAQAMWGREK